MLSCDYCATSIKSSSPADDSAAASSDFTAFLSDGDKLTSSLACEEFWSNFWNNNNTMHFYTTVSSTDTLRGVVGFEAVMSDSLQSFLLTNYAVHQLRPEVNRKILSSKGVIKLLKNRISRNDPIDINGVQDISTVHDLCCIWRRMIMLSDWKHLYSLDYSNGLVVNT